MITHEVPGDSFWDLVRKGAETAAKKDNIELRYSSDPEAPNQANLVQTAVDSVCAGHRGDAGQAGRNEGRHRKCHGQRHSHGRVQRRPRFLAEDRRQGVLRSRRLHRGAGGGPAAHRRGRQEGPVRYPGTRPRRPRSRCAGVKNTFPGTETLNVNGKDMPSVESTITAKLQQDRSIDYVVTLGAVRADRRAVGTQFR